MRLKSLLALCILALLAQDSSARQPVKQENGEDYFNLLSSDGWLMRWPKEKFPLRVFIDDGVHISGYRPQFKNILLSAMYSWSDASAGKLTFTQATSKENADIICQWTTSLNADAELPSKRPNAGASFYESFEEAGTGNIHITKVRIKIPVRRPTDGQIVTDAEMRCTCLHEIGHALGIDIHSPDTSDMMCRFNNAFKVRPVLSQRDVHTIQRLYSTFD